MQNSIKKVIGRNWEIIKEENSKTYFGYLKGSTYEDLYVEDLYYVDSTELSKKFPGYNNLTGIEINRAIYKSNAFQVEHQSTLLQDYKKTFYLKDTGIEAHIRWNYSADGNPEKVKDFIFFLDPNTGKLTDWKSISTN